MGDYFDNVPETFSTKEVIKEKRNTQRNIGFKDTISHRKRPSQQEITRLYNDVGLATGSVRAHEKLATALWDVGQFSKSLKVREKEYELRIPQARMDVENRPTDAASHYNLGMILYVCRKYSEAIDAFENSINLGNTDPGIFHILGECFHLSGRSSEAVALYKRSIELDPTDTYSYDALGEIFTLQGEYKSAATAYSKIIEIEPSDKLAQLCLANALFSMGELSKSIEICKKSIAGAPTHWTKEAYFSLAEAFFQNGQNDEAINSLKHTVTLDKNEEVSIYRLGQMYIRTGRIYEGLQAFRIVISRKSHGFVPFKSESYYSLGLTLAATGRLQKAIEVFIEGSAYEAQLDLHAAARVITHKNIEILKVFLIVEEIRHSHHNNNMDDLENKFAELSKLTGVPKERIRSFIKRFMLASEESTSSSEVSHQDHETQEVGRKPKTSNTAIAIARLQAALAELCKTDLAKATADDAEAVRISNSLKSTVKALRKRGVMDLPPEAVETVRNANRIMSAWQRQRKRGPGPSPRG